MRVFSPAHLALLTLAAGLAVSGRAAAQVHWDAGAQVGVIQRLETGLSAGAPSPIPGPIGELHAHVAIVPMLRVGPYVSYDISPFPPSAQVPARQIAEGGVRAKVAPPLLTGSWHLWALLGIGYAYAYWPSHSDNAVSVRGVDGGILDLPVGVRVGYRLRGPRDPWELTAELAGRVGLAFFGAMYSDAPRDSFALSLSVGVSLEE